MSSDHRARRRVNRGAARPLRLRIAALLAVLATGCASGARTPFTLRERAPLRFTAEQMAVLGAEARREMLDRQELVGSNELRARVSRVAGRLVDVVPTEARRPERWRFRILDTPETVNAMALPDGSVLVFSGLLDVATEDGLLAAALAHEMAHVLLEHANERIGRPKWKAAFDRPVQLVLGVWRTLAPGTRRFVLDSLGFGRILKGFTPYSQEHENEADLVGLHLMYRAGFTLTDAPRLWERLETLRESPDADGLCTHPDPEDRARRLRRIITETRGIPARALPDPEGTGRP